MLYWGAQKLPPQNLLFSKQGESRDPNQPQLPSPNWYLQHSEEYWEAHDPNGSLRLKGEVHRTQRSSVVSQIMIKDCHSSGSMDDRINGSAIVRLCKW
jgi:hypothetical protein